MFIKSLFEDYINGNLESTSTAVEQKINKQTKKKTNDKINHGGFRSKKPWPLKAYFERVMTHSTVKSMVSVVKLCFFYDTGLIIRSLIVVKLWQR